ncbi:MAG TPA: DUF6350 family protein [Segeticoccus sp.]|uniref:cell division protein PerM n=1 Tax=Segeticoccus sp. TaxID=2706531 RepID=UPI002D7F6492|nr:DUF6350 family protein [Segeticoccus sp.]HET8598695.1 DUF6350 family protein [Segeticoccus sp.]
MSLLERTRRSTAVTSATSGDWSPYLRTAAWGVLAALVPLAFLAVPVVVAWAADGRARADWTTVVGMAATVWALAHGASVHAGDGTVRFVPLLLLLLPLWSTWWFARRVLPHTVQVPDRGDTAQVLPLAGSYVVGQLVGAVLIVAAGLLGPAPPTWLSTLTAALVVALLGTGAALRQHVARLSTGGVGGAEDEGPRPPLPRCVTRAGRPALLTVAALGALGALLSLVAVLFHLSRIVHLQQALEPGAVGGTVLALAQLLALPNALVWAVSWCAGSGLAVGDLAVSWTHVHDGILPLVPALGALPEPGPLPGWLPAVVLLPVGCGAFLAWRVVASMARLSAWQDHLRTTAVACGLAATGLAGLGWLSGGSLGSGHLAHVGPPPLLLWVFLLGELAGGALIFLVVWHWRLRR